MVDNELKYLWASPENGIAPERARTFAAKAVAQINRQRRRRRGMLIYVSAMVSLATVFAGWQLLRHSTGIGESAPAIMMLAAQWIAAWYLWRIFRGSPSAAVDQPIRATLEAVLDKTRARCRELQVLLGLFLAVAPLVALAIYQLQENGKMRPHEAASAGALFGTILLGMTGWFLFDLFARKLPEKRHLEALLREYC